MFSKYIVINTTNDRSKSFLHRNAARFEFEPSLGGVRIRLGSPITITREHYEKNEAILREWVSKGMVEIIPLEQNTDIPSNNSVPKDPEPPLPPEVKTKTFEEDVEIEKTPTSAEYLIATLAKEAPTPEKAEEVVSPLTQELKKGNNNKKKLF